ncbi:MAG: hypothetical protein WC551_13775 [Patescibacteria group bacterium]
MTKQEIKSTLILGQKFHDAMEIAASLSRDMIEGESAVAWVKRVIREREYARDTVSLIDRECSLCELFKTLPDRVQSLIRQRQANAPDQTRLASSGTGGSEVL